MARRINYLNNKDLLLEILNSKYTYSEFLDEQYKRYDAIINSLDEVTPELIEELKEKRVLQKLENDRQELKDKGKREDAKNLEPDSTDTIATEDLVFHLMTYDHIPKDPDRVKKKKKESDDYVKLNFDPFKHFILKDGEFKEVGRSHWTGGFHNGHFSQDHGRMTDKHAHMITLLVYKYSQKGNWRGLIDSSF